MSTIISKNGIWIDGVRVAGVPTIAIHDGSPVEGGTAWVWGPTWTGDIDSYLEAVADIMRSAIEYADGDIVTVHIDGEPYTVRCAE